MKKQAKNFRKPEKVKDLMKAASNVMAVKGYAQMSMRDIAEEAGVHKSLLYHYFKNKDELFLELFRYLNKQYIDIITDVSNLSSDSQQKIETGVLGFLEFVVSEPKWIMMILDLMVQTVQKPEGKKEIVFLYSNLLRIIRETFKEGKDDKKFNHEFDEKMVSSLMLSTLMGLGVFYVMDEDLIDFPHSCEYFLKMIEHHCSK